MRWVYGSTRDPPARQEDAAHDRGQHRVDANAEGVQEAGRKEKGPRNEMCSLVDASRNVQGREEVRKCVNALTQKKRTLRGVAAHLRLVIFVSLRMAASAVTPLSPMSL